MQVPALPARIIRSATVASRLVAQSRRGEAERREAILTRWHQAPPRPSEGARRV